MDIIKKLGGPTKVAELLENCSTQAVSKWKGKVPADRVLEIVYAKNGEVTPYELRPDLYPDPNWLPPGVPDKDEAA